jgi:hypothetical protein
MRSMAEGSRGGGPCADSLGAPAVAKAMTGSLRNAPAGSPAEASAKAGGGVPGRGTSEASLGAPAVAKAMAGSLRDAPAGSPAEALAKAGGRSWQRLTLT